MCTIGNTISPATQAALTSFHSAGGSVFIATGRGVTAATEVVDKYLPGIIQYCVCMDGACVVQAPNWDIIFDAGFRGEEVSRLLSNIQAEIPGCCFGALPLMGHDSDVVSAQGYVDLVGASDSDMAAGILARGEGPRVSADFIAEMAATDTMGWVRVLHADGDQEALLAALAPIVARENELHGSGVVAGASIISGGVMLRRGTTNKSVGLAHMAEKLGIAPVR